MFQFKYKKRVYKQSQVNVYKLKHLHSKVPVCVWSCLSSECANENLLTL